jgi:hypothetical protein
MHITESKKFTSNSKIYELLRVGDDLIPQARMSAVPLEGEEIGHLIALHWQGILYLHKLILVKDRVERSYIHGPVRLAVCDLLIRSKLSCA